LIPNSSWFQVYVCLESLKVHFSPSIYGAFIELSTHLDSLLLRNESETLNYVYPPNIVSDAPSYSTFGISVISRLGSVDLEVDLENRGDNSSVLMVSLQQIDVRYVHKCPSSVCVGLFPLWWKICILKSHPSYPPYLLCCNYINLQFVCCVMFCMTVLVDVIEVFVFA
jgi:hypothetical protein